MDDPIYLVKANDPSSAFYIFVLAYTAFVLLLIAPLVAWSRSNLQKEILEEEPAAPAHNNATGGTKDTDRNSHTTFQGTASVKPLPKGGSQVHSTAGKSLAVSSITGSHTPTNATGVSRQVSVRSGRSGLGLILDKVAGASYPDQALEFQLRLGASAVGGQTVVSKTPTAKSSRAPSAATTSRLHTSTFPSSKKLSSLVFDVGGRRWANRRPIGRIDVIHKAVNQERANSVISGLSAAKRAAFTPDPAIHPLSRKRSTKGMSDVASSMLEDTTPEIMRPNGNYTSQPRGPSAMHHRARFVRGPNRIGSYYSASEKSFSRSVMSSIVDDISPQDAADANDPGRGNIFLQGAVQSPRAQGIDSGLKMGCFSTFVESMLDLAAPGEEMRRAVQSAIPLSMGAVSEALYRVITAVFISQYLGTESMIAYLLVGLFVRLTSEELSGAIIDALSSFVQACLFSGGQGDMALQAGQYAQHALVLQLVLGIPLLLAWALTMEDVVFWLVQSTVIAEMARGYAEVIVANYMVQAFSRTCTVVFHICGHEHFESVIDFTTSTLQLIVVACIVSRVANATLTTVAYVQLLFGIAGAVAKIMYAVMMGWLKPFRRGMFGELAILKNPQALRHMVRAIVPLLLGTVLEYGEWEVLTLFLRHLGPAEVATWAILGAIWDVLEALTEGIGEASATQVAFLLAALQPQRAQKLANTVIYLAIVQALLITAALYMSGKYLAVLFTDDPTLQHLFNNTISLLGLANVTMSFAQISWSLVGAQGRFQLATSIVFFARWGVTIPMAVVVIFAFFLDLNSVSGALVVGYATAACALTFIVLRTDWERLARVMQEVNAPSNPVDKNIVGYADNGFGDDDDDEDGDPFDDFDDDSDSSDGFGFGFGGDDDSEMPSSAVSGRSRNTTRSKKSRQSASSKRNVARLTYPVGP